jgi:hypothetical protein
MSGLWAKLNLKDQRDIAVLNAPDSFATELPYSPPSSVTSMTLTGTPCGKMTTVQSVES